MLVPVIFFLLYMCKGTRMFEYNREKKKRIVAFSGSAPQQWEEWMGCQNFFCSRRCDMGMDAHWSLSLCSHLPTLLKRTYLEILPFYINGPTLSFFDRKVSLLQDAP